MADVRPDERQHSPMPAAGLSPAPALCVDCGAPEERDGRCELCYEAWAYLTYQRGAYQDANTSTLIVGDY